MSAHSPETIQAANRAPMNVPKGTGIDRREIFVYVGIDFDLHTCRILIATHWLNVLLLPHCGVVPGVVQAPFNAISLTKPLGLCCRQVSQRHRIS
jgi:hypothetical protein